MNIINQIILTGNRNYFIENSKQGKQRGIHGKKAVNSGKNIKSQLYLNLGASYVLKVKKFNIEPINVFFNVEHHIYFNKRA